MRTLNHTKARFRTVAFMSLLACSYVHAQQTATGDEGSGKEEGNRNVMLNASSANGPREIQIGLPSADVNVLENGLPVTYATNPHSINSNWRSDASLSHVGLLKISETAITTGNIGYAVNSFTQLGQEGFNGRLDYKSNHFGLQEFSLNLNGSIGKGWYYSTSLYQDFDPGTFKIRSTPFQDRTQIYKAALTRRYSEGRGEFTAMYRYSNSHPVYTYATQSAPFIYAGDGSVKEYGGFRLGTTSYLPKDNTMTYRDMRTGELKQTTLYDAIANRSSEVSLMNTYKWDNGLALRDWRYVVRIANIDVSNLSEPSSAANIAKLMVKALHRIPNRGMGRPVFYMNRTVGQALDLQSLEKTSLAISVKETEGEWWTSFRGVPIRETDALLETEARVV